MLAWDSVWGWDVDPFDKLHVIDYGDCQFDPGQPQSIPEVVQAQFSHILNAGAAMLCWAATISPHTHRCARTMPNMDRSH